MNIIHSTQKSSAKERSLFLQSLGKRVFRPPLVLESNDSNLNFFNHSSEKKSEITDLKSKIRNKERLSEKFIVTSYRRRKYTRWKMLWIYLNCLQKDLCGLCGYSLSDLCIFAFHGLRHGFINGRGRAEQMNMLEGTDELS
jgi:hypothetical protein